MTHFTTTTAISALLAAALVLPAAANNHSEMKMDKTSKAEFSDIDTNADGRIDFTEYSNYSESKMGMSAADSAVEYVRFANDDGVITEASFSMMMSGDKMNGTKKTTKTMTTTDGMTTTTTTETMESSQSMTMTPGMSKTDMEKGMTEADKMMKAQKKMSNDAMNNMRTSTTRTGASMNTDGSMIPETNARPSGTVMSETMTTSSMQNEANRMAEYGRFSDYDMNGNGEVTFAEYSKARRKAGVTNTKAAQDFIRLSNGSSSFDESRFTTSMNADVLAGPSYTRTTVLTSTTR